MRPDLHPREAERLQALSRYVPAARTADHGFDEVVEYLRDAFDVPVALVSLVESDRQSFLARLGFDGDHTPIDMAICGHAILEGNYLEIEDLTQDPRTSDNPLVTGPDHMRFYAGAVLKTLDGLPLGTLCVLDSKPRSLTAFQRRTLKLLSSQVMARLELVRALDQAEVLRLEADHRVKNSLQSVASLLRIQQRASQSRETKLALATAGTRIETVAQLHQALYRTELAETVEMASFVASLEGLMGRWLPSHVTFVSDLAPLAVRSSQASGLATILAEFCANSVRHGYAGRQSGTIRAVGRQHDDEYVLVLSDDGNGMATGAPVSQDGGLGMRVIEAAVDQLGATYDFVNAEGGGVELSLRLPRRRGAAPD